MPVDPVTRRLKLYAPETGFSYKPSRSNRTCIICGEAKNNTGRGQAHRECYMQVRSVKVLVRCAWCSVDFRKPRYEYNKALRRGHFTFYCCKDHSQAHHAVKNAKPCDQCRVPMPGRSTRKFCSMQCRIDSREHPEKACTVCGVFFRPKSSRTAYCTRVCADKAHSVRMLGYNNPHYKDGTSYSKWFRETRPLIFERDKDSCVVCSKPFKPITFKRNGAPTQKSNLIVHHVDEDPRNNRVENLVLLCASCHLVHHKSTVTPYPWFGEYARQASESMTSKWMATATSLLTAYSSTTA
uniref:HNH endonuclease n=1 Tax=Streptomyces sp. W9 TaxID=682410 RepID=UPI001EE22D63|nr:HNH endonuclease signature motif containing protein [Streptomyces sp. W9]